jgi:hypothetical protein
MGTLLVAVALALLVIYAGIKLLIQVKKEALGNLYKIAAWGLIIAAKVLILMVAVASILMCLKFGMRKNKMKHRFENQGGMWHHQMHGGMMHQGGQNGMCGMNNMSGCAMEGMSTCKMEGMCDMPGHCKMNENEGKNCCANMMMNCAADSSKRKK